MLLFPSMSIKKRKKDAPMGAAKFTPWGCPQFISISEVPNTPTAFNPACSLFSSQFKRGMVIPLKQQPSSCCKPQQSTRMGFPPRYGLGSQGGLESPRPCADPPCCCCSASHNVMSICRLHFIGFYLAASLDSAL